MGQSRHMPRKGDMVTIFQRPLVKEEVEGEAALVYLQDDNVGVYGGHLVQRWLVKFTGDAQQYSRSVLTDAPHDWECQTV